MGISGSNVAPVGLQPGTSCPTPAKRSQGVSEGPEGHGKGRQGVAELPLCHLLGHGERNGLGGRVSPPPQGVTPALSTVWATREEKHIFKEQREQSGRTPSGLFLGYILNN